MKAPDSLVVSFRAPKDLVDRLDVLAVERDRTRASTILILLRDAVRRNAGTITRPAASPAKKKRS